MADKKPSEENAPARASISENEAAEIRIIPDTNTLNEISISIERQNTQIEALARATSALSDSLFAANQQSQRDAAYFSAIDGVHRASLAVQSGVAAQAAVPGIEQRVEECGCGQCRGQCVSSNCCCFDIYVVSVRALAMQDLELADSVANPWSELEVQLFAYLETGVGAVIPSMFSALGLRKLVQHPGIPVTVERFIGQVCVPKGESKRVKVTVDALELDAGLAERATGGRDEEGTAYGTLSLNCCSCDDQETEFDLSFTSGGQGGGTIGIKIAARPN